MVDNSDYFTINRGRQYGKTTMLMSLVRYLGKDYNVVFLDFQDLSSSSFENVVSFVRAASSALLYVADHLDKGYMLKLLL